MVVLVIFLSALLLILTGCFWPALVATGWVIAAVIGAMLLAAWLRSLFHDAIALFSLAAPTRYQTPRFEADAAAPRPGDPEWLDWANRDGKYAPRPPRA